MHAFTCPRTNDLRTVRHTSVKWALRAAISRVPAISTVNEPLVHNYLRRKEGVVRSQERDDMKADIAVLDASAASTRLIDVTIRHHSGPLVPCRMCWKRENGQILAKHRP